MSLNEIVNLYVRGRFTVRTIMMDTGFEKIRDQPGMRLVNINTAAAREHVAEIERGIRFIKENLCCTAGMLSVLGIWYLPKQVVVRMAHTVITSISRT